jgi:spore coat polysaccharide biosynthesis protein SpsF
MSSATAAGIVIQARTGSVRLPGKVLKPIGNRALLEHVLERAARSRLSRRTVVATTTLIEDDQLEAFCRERGIECFRGSSEDVLHRYWQCARALSIDPVVRLTADNPLVDADELDRLIQLHLAGQYDYSHSLGELPIGVGAEVFSASCLERSCRAGTAAHHREHVNEYVLENKHLFRIGRLSVPPQKQSPRTRLTVDTEEDYRRICFIVQNASSHSVTTEEAIALCSRFT